MPTPPLITHWPYAIVYWAVFIWAYAPEFGLNRRSKLLPGPQDAGSFRVVVLMQSLAIVAGFAIAFAGRRGTLAYRPVWFGAGLGLLIAGSLLRRHCFRMLGGSFTAVVVVRPEQQVVERGMYRWVRHPSYTAGILMLCGTMLALGNWISVAVVLGGSALGYSYRVHVEERALLQTLGEPYRAYMQRTKRFVPKVF